MPQLFLSHLCGDEATFDFGVATATFLSHLCGDEDRLAQHLLDSLFLSHLCGDEASRSLLASS